MIRLEGQEFPTPVIFAVAGEPTLLGVVTLEDALLAVAPVAGRPYLPTRCAFSPGSRQPNGTLPDDTLPLA